MNSCIGGRSNFRYLPSRIELANWRRSRGDPRRSSTSFRTAATVAQRDPGPSNFSADLAVSATSLMKASRVAALKRTATRASVLPGYKSFRLEIRRHAPLASSNRTPELYCIPKRSFGMAADDSLTQAGDSEVCRLLPDCDRTVSSRATGLGWNAMKRRHLAPSQASALSQRASPLRR
jgi:hypothetical protein